MSLDYYTIPPATQARTSSDALGSHRGMSFTTKDRDNNKYSAKNCALEFKGAWWYKSCHSSNLNGLYLNGKDDCQGILHPRRPRGSQSCRKKGATKVFKYGRKSPWVPTLTKLFPEIQADAGSCLDTKNTLYYCAQSANSFS